jgi:hypothetical protein
MTASLKITFIDGTQGVVDGFQNEYDEHGYMFRSAYDNAVIEKHKLLSSAFYVRLNDGACYSVCFISSIDIQED